jgi:hypothetical protein
MARMHLLQSVGYNVYDVVVHAPTPNSNNAAGVPWATAIANSGRAISSLPVGNGPGQITQSELNQVQAGTLIEARFQWGDDPSWTNQQRQDDLQVRAQQAVQEVTALLQQQLKFFGFTVT